MSNRYSHTECEFVRQKQTNADTLSLILGPTFMYAERRLKYWGSGLRTALPPSS